MHQVPHKTHGVYDVLLCCEKIRREDAMPRSSNGFASPFESPSFDSRKPAQLSESGRVRSPSTSSLMKTPNGAPRSNGKNAFARAVSMVSQKNSSKKKDGGAHLRFEEEEPRLTSNALEQNDAHTREGELYQSDSNDDVSDAQSLSSTGSAEQMTNHILQLVQGLAVQDKTGRFIPTEELVHTLVQQVGHAIRSLAPVAIVLMNADCTIIDVNPKAEETFGRDADEMVGKNIKVLMPPEIASKHDGFVSRFLTTWDQKRKQPKSTVVNGVREVLATRMVNGKSETFSASISVRAIMHPAGKQHPPLMFLGYVEDISEQRKLQEALEISAFIREKGDTPLIVMSDYGRILEFNQAAADMFRYNRTFLLGQNIKKLMPPATAAVHDEKMETHRERVSTGMIHTSPVCGKTRVLVAYRPKFETVGCEEFRIELRVEGFSGGKVLVAFLRDLDSVDSSAFMADVTADTFPSHTVDRLIRGEPVWDQMESISVLFSDVVGFSAASAELDPEDIFNFVNGMVSAFDEMGYGMEKIKTIGDGYMAFFKSADDALYTALRMLEWSQENEVYLRVGIHTGPVVSGVVGKTRRTFDMWGETVNTAKRMEENGVNGQVQVSMDTFDALDSDDLRSVFTGHSAPLKGRGVVDTYITDLPPDHIPDFVLSLLADRDVEERTMKAARNKAQNV